MDLLFDGMEAPEGMTQEQGCEADRFAGSRSEVTTGPTLH